jgi:hypothetical protein
MTPHSTLTLADKYLRTARELSQMLIRSDNKSSLVTNSPISIREFDRRTRRSDTNLGVPLLFTFYHGVELCLKGHSSGQGVPAKPTHTLTKLLNGLKENQNNREMKAEILKWLPPGKATPIGRFLTTNKITIDDWYQALKYTRLSSGKDIDHFDLKYGGLRTIDFWKSLNASCSKLIVASATCANLSQYEYVSLVWPK